MWSQETGARAKSGTQAKPGSLVLFLLQQLIHVVLGLTCVIKTIMDKLTP